MGKEAKLLAQRLIRYRRDLPNLVTVMEIDLSESTSGATKQGALADLFVALAALLRTLSTLGMRAKGSTTSAGP